MSALLMMLQVRITWHTKFEVSSVEAAADGRI